MYMHTKTRSLHFFALCKRERKGGGGGEEEGRQGDQDLGVGQARKHTEYICGWPRICAGIGIGIGTCK